MGIRKQKLYQNQFFYQFLEEEYKYLYIIFQSQCLCIFKDNHVEDFLVPSYNEHFYVRIIK